MEEAKADGETIWPKLIIGSEEVNKNNQSGFSIAVSRFESGTYGIQSEIANHSVPLRCGKYT